jgi:hypothetical protein
MVDDDSHIRRISESLTALSDGTASMVGPLSDTQPRRLVLASGCYGQAADGSVRPLPGPNWIAAVAPGGHPLRSRLDLRAGVLELGLVEGPARITRFQSAARPGTGVERITDPCVRTGEVLLETPDELGPLASQFAFERHPTTSDGVAAAATVSDRAAITVAVGERMCTDGLGRSLERYAAVLGDRFPVWSDSIEVVAEA